MHLSIHSALVSHFGSSRWSNLGFNAIAFTWIYWFRKTSRFRVLPQPLPQAGRSSPTSTPDPFGSLLTPKATKSVSALGKIGTERTRFVPTAWRHRTPHPGPSAH